MDRSASTHTEPLKNAPSGLANYELAVVGAGVAGLNALNAATDYLPRGARVLLVDQKDTAGGMWNTAYDYVRLHQPHPMFTVGDLRWKWRKPRQYLAARDEVRSHLSSSLDPIANKVCLETRFGQTVERCAEVETSNGPMAELFIRPNGNSGEKRSVVAKRAIYASGLNYSLAEPLAFSSQQVLSIIPQDLLPTLKDNPDAPVFVIGGGKTGMDTVLATLAADAERNVTLINGRGTNFLNRTRYLPTGFKRWTSGQLASRVFKEIATAFDGANEDQLIEYIRRNLSTDPVSESGAFLYGLQSEEEHARIHSGLANTLSDYLVNVVDNVGEQFLLTKNGIKMPVATGAIFVNCTGSFFRSKNLSEPRQILSENERVLSLTSRDSFHFLTSVAGFFTSHLYFRGQLRGHGFYTVDLEDLFQKNRNAWVGATAAQAYLNQVTALQTLPLTLLNRCGLDMDRWYPLPRRLAALVSMKTNADRDVAHCRKVLDRVASRFETHSKRLN